MENFYVLISLERILIEVYFIKTLLFILTIISILIINDADIALTNRDISALSIKGMIYPVLLFISFGFIHYVLEKYIIPIDKLSVQKKEQIIKNGNKHYKKGFFNGVIGLGYLMLFLYYLSYFSSIENPVKAGIVPLALFFVILGIIAKAKGIIVFLVNEYSEKPENTNDELSEI